MVRPTRPRGARSTFQSHSTFKTPAACAAGVLRLKARQILPHGSWLGSDGERLVTRWINVLFNQLYSM